MKTICSAFIAILLSLTASTALAEGKGEPDKYYLFIGKMDQPAIEWFLNNPTDTFPGFAKETEQLGGKLHSYYWSIKDATMYAIVSYPSHIEAAAQRYQRAATLGIAKDVELIEILTSEQMIEVFARAKKHNDYFETRLEKGNEASQ